MKTTPPTGFPGAASTSSGYRLKRDSYVWLAGTGYRHMERGSLLTGYLLRRNEIYQKLVLATNEGVLNVNEEDVEPVGLS
jgi:hypothetical protein